MPDSFDAVRALYGEPRPDGTLSTPDALDAAARAEMAALAPIKAALDARPPHAPDAEALAAILDAARAAQLERTQEGSSGLVRPRAADRAAAKPARRSRSRVALPVLALFACAAIGIAVVIQQPASPLADAVPALTEAAPVLSGGDAEAEDAEASAPDVVPEADGVPEADAVQQAGAENASVQGPASAPVLPGASRVAGTPPGARATSPAAPSPSVAASSDASTLADDAMRREVVPGSPIGVPAARRGLSLASAAPVETPPSWDAPTDEDLRLLSLRLQALREANEGLTWDEPPVALSVSATGALRARDLTSDTAHDETRVGFHATPPPGGGSVCKQAGASIRPKQGVTLKLPVFTTLPPLPCCHASPRS